SGIHRGFEQIAATAARLSGVESDATVLRDALAQRDAALDSANARVQTSEAREANAVAEMERWQKRVAELAQERDEMAASAEASRAAENAAFAASEIEIASLRAETEYKLRDAHTRFAREAASLRQEITELRTLLARATGDRENSDNARR